jgi:hypothetical protein
MAELREGKPEATWKGTPVLKSHHIEKSLLSLLLVRELRAQGLEIQVGALQFKEG